MDQDTKRGLYGKYHVTRTDGSSEIGAKHHLCEYFVLDLDHDFYAIPALRAYALACADRYPSLAEDILIKLDSIEQELLEKIFEEKT